MSTPSKDSAPKPQASQQPQSGVKSLGWVRRLAPLAFIISVLCAFFALGGPKYISIDSLRDNRETLSALVANHFALSLLGFMGLYALLVSISFPGASLLSIFGGFLFGTLAGGAAITLGATLGALGIFLAARYAIGDALMKKAGPYMQKFEAGLKQNELSYLFILRLIPAFPFFIVNIVPGLFDVKVRNYLISTFFGIIPGCFVYASVGAGIGAIFDSGGDVKLGGLMTQPKILFPILGLIALSILPIAYKKLKRANP